MEKERTGGHEHFSNHEKDDASQHPEKPKHGTKRFHPWESTAKLSEETNKTKGASPDTNKPEGTSTVSSNSTNEEPFGNGWLQKQLDIVRNSGYLLPLRDQASKGTRRLELEADAGEGLSETKIQNSTPEQTTIHRVAESAYRLVEDYMKYLGRS